MTLEGAEEMCGQKYTMAGRSIQWRVEIYNGGYALVVTDLTANPPVRRLVGTIR